MPQGSGWRWALPALLFIAPLLLWPAGTILARGLAPEGHLSLDVAEAVVRDRYYWERLAFSLGQAAASTVLAVTVGLPAAWAFALVRFPGRSLLRAVVTVPFVLPTIVVALAFERLLGPGGWTSRVADALGIAMPEVNGTIWAILLAHVFYNVSVVIRVVGGVWANLDPATLEAAQMLGAGRVRRFTAVTLPALLPALLSASALVFMFCFTAFGTVLLLGGGGAAFFMMKKKAAEAEAAAAEDGGGALGEHPVIRLAARERADGGGGNVAGENALLLNLAEELRSPVVAGSQRLGGGAAGGRRKALPLREERFR